MVTEQSCASSAHSASIAWLNHLKAPVITRAFGKKECMKFLRDCDGMPIFGIFQLLYSRTPFHLDFVRDIRLVSSVVVFRFPFKYLSFPPDSTQSITHDNIESTFSTSR